MTGVILRDGGRGRGRDQNLLHRDGGTTTMTLGGTIEIGIEVDEILGITIDGKGGEVEVGKVKIQTNGGEWIETRSLRFHYTDSAREISALLSRCPAVKL